MTKERTRPSTTLFRTASRLSEDSSSVQKNLFGLDLSDSSSSDSSDEEKVLTPRNSESAEAWHKEALFFAGNRAPKREWPSQENLSNKRGCPSP